MERSASAAQRVDALCSATYLCLSLAVETGLKCNTVLHKRILEKKPKKNKKQVISTQVYMGMKLNHTEEFKVNSR